MSNEASSNTVRRRRVIATLGSVSLGAGAGCSGLFSGNDVRDTDGDGVIDSEDYAPRDPAVQERSDIQRTETATESEPASPTERLAVGSASSQRGQFVVLGPKAVRPGRPFPLVGGVAEADREQYGAFETYIDGERVHDVGLQQKQAALFADTYRISSTGTRRFTVEVRFVNGDEGVDERVGRVTLAIDGHESAPTRMLEIVEQSGSSGRGTFRVRAPSAVPAGAHVPVAGTVTEASSEQYGAFEVYVNGNLVRNVGLQEGQSARFGRLYDTSGSGPHEFIIEVRFVNGDFDIDERVGRTVIATATTPTDAAPSTATPTPTPTPTPTATPTPTSTATPAPTATSATCPELSNFDAWNVGFSFDYGVSFGVSNFADETVSMDATFFLWGEDSGEVEDTKRRQIAVDGNSNRNFEYRLTPDVPPTVNIDRISVRIEGQGCELTDSANVV